VTFQPTDYTRSPDFQPTQPRRRGCLIGCGVALIVAVLLAVILGLVARVEYNKITGNNTTTTSVTVNPNAKSVSALEYGQMISGHGSALKTDSDKVAQACKSIGTGNHSECRSAINQFHNDLEATQTDLNGVKPPPNLSDADLKLRESVSEGLAGTAEVNTGLNGHPVTLAKGMLDVTRSLNTLEKAESTLNHELLS
jgi:hypothetical protein